MAKFIKKLCVSTQFRWALSVVYGMFVVQNKGKGNRPKGVKNGINNESKSRNYK